MSDKNIVLDEKTKKTVKSIQTQMGILQGQLETILQTYVNSRFPNSNDVYELSEDSSELRVIEEKGQP